MRLAFARDHAHLPASVSVEDFASKCFLDQFPLAVMKHFGRGDDGLHANVINTLIQEERSEQSGGVCIGKDCLGPESPQFLRELHHATLRDGRGVEDQFSLKQPVSDLPLQLLRR